MNCDKLGHRHNRHHHHCYHCGRTTGNHRTWCPDGNIAPDAGLSGWWAYNVGCKGD